MMPTGKIQLSLFLADLEQRGEKILNASSEVRDLGHKKIAFLKDLSELDQELGPQQETTQKMVEQFNLLVKTYAMPIASDLSDGTFKQIARLFENMEMIKTTLQRESVKCDQQELNYRIVCVSKCHLDVSRVARELPVPRNCYPLPLLKRLEELVDKSINYKEEVKAQVDSLVEALEEERLSTRFLFEALDRLILNGGLTSDKEEELDCLLMRLGEEFNDQVCDAICALDPDSEGCREWGRRRRFEDLGRLRQVLLEVGSRVIEETWVNTLPMADNPVFKTRIYAWIARKICPEEISFASEKEAADWGKEHVILGFHLLGAAERACTGEFEDAQVSDLRRLKKMAETGQELETAFLQTEGLGALRLSEVAEKRVALQKRKEEIQGALKEGLSILSEQVRSSLLCKEGDLSNFESLYDAIDEEINRYIQVSQSSL